ncbi:uncharacterized protein LOC123864202 isoform X2 [Maniola jurtina]|uniref:uncharacterized protein LOC123864202 isoform X2 n=1 Tax=Maniola jurtina TaxID=191418 RepID=UPI001E689A8A|nr:uncharacterized protein LOC123864202 isoform X2 [Maniola jurtina]
MFTSLLPYILLAPVFVSRTQCLCGESITWSHRVNMDDVFGLWYGVGYAQHSPNIPSEVGCISLFITDVNKYEDNWFDWSIQRSGYSPRNNWRSSKSNPWSENDMAGSWLDGRLKRQVKRSVEGEKRIRVLWDEDGNTSEQVYVYYEEEPGLWTAEQMQPSEKELISRDVWYPDDPPRHPGVIRIIKLTPHMLILNHCSEVGNGGIFSLILRRSSTTVQRWEWYQYQQQFYKFYLPNIYRFYAICAAGTEIGSFVIVLFCFISLFLIS